MLVAVEGTYYNGQVHLNDQVPFDHETKVIVTFLEEPETTPRIKRLTFNDFSFRKTREALSAYKGSFSDAVIQERGESL